VAKLPVTAQKRTLDDEGEEEDEQPTTTKKRAVSKPTTEEKSSMKTVTTVAGQAPVDSSCTSLLGKAHVYVENKDIFDCMLNQVNDHFKSQNKTKSCFFVS